jgi:hypothetical protein
MSKATTPPQDIVLEHLKRIQGDLADLKRDVRDLKASNGMILGMTGELVKAAGRTDERFAELEIRVDRIEQRLGLHDQPTA